MIGLDELFSVAGKVALVTGGGRGIGLMITEALVASGARVYIASRKREVCEKVAAQLGGDEHCIGLGADLSTEAGVVGLADEIKRREARLHILVNNSGAAWGAPLEDFPWGAWDKVLDLNLIAPFVLTRELLPLLARAGTAADPARVVNVGSMLGTITKSWTAYSYAASKAGLHHITRIFANELAERHINDRHLPDKAIDVVDEAGASLRLKPEAEREKTVTVAHIEAVVAALGHPGVSSAHAAGAESPKAKAPRTSPGGGSRSKGRSPTGK